MNSTIDDMTWRTSSHSNGTGDCVEVADGLRGFVPVRDSKARDGAALAVAAGAWAAFVPSVKDHGRV
ncbi:DUF397 domain-containing protein [Streptomyces marincola]|uniref:DUF397 domain-containing protein n=1 Tax=Streptomyces marincola TaxID=2878388 RepID=A0A1W7CS76_9ACTN|nr:DUF397 domain-containing protein [Streptomyces marincola]ARQ67654.1 hypothetical protein CAG99_01355 [Streptomyces marincola]